MAIQNQPGFIPAPFANSGTKNVIPETMPTPSASAIKPFACANSMTFVTKCCFFGSSWMLAIRLRSILT